VATDIATIRRHLATLTATQLTHLSGDIADADLKQQSN
jgi:hypothetical protein